MHALSILSEEHQSLAGVLHALRFMLKEIAAGALAPDVKLLRAMVHYLEAYAEQRHHPKEEILFAALTSRTDEGAEAVATLLAEHADGPQRIAALKTALNAYVADAGQLPDLSAAFDRYAEFYRRHMLLEKDVVLPLVRKHVSAADGAAVDAAFAAEEARCAALGSGEDFSALFQRLVDCAPEPIGHGAGPF